MGEKPSELSSVDRPSVKPNTEVGNRNFTPEKTFDVRGQFHLPSNINLPPALADIPNILKKLGFPDNIIKEMMEGMADKLSPVLSSPSIDPKIKERLLSLVVEKLEDISRYSKEGLQSWASDLREVMTANTLPDPRTDMSFYHKKFIGLRIQNLGDITSGLMVAYGPRTTVGKFSYNGLDYTALRDGIRGIDGKLGLNIGNFIDQYATRGTEALGKSMSAYTGSFRGDIATENLRGVLAENILDQIETKLGTKLESRQHILNLTKSGTLNLESFIKGTKEYDIATFIQMYLGQLTNFQSKERSITNIRNTAEGKNDFLIAGTSFVEDHPFKEKKEIGDLKLGEILVTLFGASQALPYIGTGTGIISDTLALRSGLDSEGGQANKAISALGIIGGGVNMLTLDAVPLDKLFKAKKIGEALALVKRVLEQLPRAIEQAIKVGEINPVKLSGIIEGLEKIAIRLEQNGIPLNSYITKIKEFLSTPASGVNQVKKARETGEARTTIAQGRVRDIGPAIDRNLSIRNDTQRIALMQADFPELRSLTADQFKELIKIHEFKELGETVGKYSIQTLGTKQRKTNDLLVNSGMDTDIAKNLVKKLIKGGYLGEVAEVDKLNTVVDDSRKIIDSMTKKGINMVTFLEKLEYDIQNGRAKGVDQSHINAIVFTDPEMRSGSNLKTYLEAFSLKVPDGLEAMFTQAKAFAKTEQMAELIRSPRLIKADTIMPMTVGSSGKVEQIGLLEAFLKSGSSGEIEKFLTTQVAKRYAGGSFLSQCGEPTIIKLILEKASTNDILYSSVLSKLLGAIPETTPLETLSLLKGKVAEAMKKRILDESFGKSLAARLDLLLDKYNPYTIVQGYLRGEGNIDETRRLLSQSGSDLRNAWNSNIIITVRNQDPKEFLELLRRGEPEFINSGVVHNLADFIYLKFDRLEKSQQNDLRSWFDKGGKYESIYNNWSGTIKSILFPERFGK